MKTTLTAALCLLPALAVQGLAGADQPFSLEFSPGYTVSKGNTDRVGLSAGLDLEWITPGKELVFAVNTAYAETDGKKDVNQSDATLDYDVNLTERETVFVLFMPSYNEFQKLDLRLQSGAGYKHSFVKTDKARISMSAALLYETEDLSGDLRSSDVMRFSFRPKLKFKLGADDSFSLIFFYQPRTGRWKDYRTKLETELDFYVWKNLSFEVKLTGEHNEIVPAGVKKNDLTLINGLKLKF